MSKLDTVLIGRKPIGKCTAMEAREYMERAQLLGVNPRGVVRLVNACRRRHPELSPATSDEVLDAWCAARD